MMVQWDRVMELWYPSFSAWRNGGHRRAAGIHAA